MAIFLRSSAGTGCTSATVHPHRYMCQCRAQRYKGARGRPVRQVGAKRHTPRTGYFRRTPYRNNCRLSQHAWHRMKLRRSFMTFPAQIFVVGELTTRIAARPRDVEQWWASVPDSNVQKRRFATTPTGRARGGNLPALHRIPTILAPLLEGRGPAPIRKMRGPQRSGGIFSPEITFPVHLGSQSNCILSL